MIHLYLWAILWIWDTVSQPSLEKINEAKLAAERAFEGGDYLAAALYFKQVVDASIFSDPAGRLNMANSFFLAGKVDEAFENYRILTRVDDPALASKAKAQLGMIALARKDTVKALNQMRAAILLDRNNRRTIANFEVLRFNFSGKIDETGTEVARNEQPDTTRSPVESRPEPDQMNDAVVELSDQREKLLQNLDKINMSEEQAKSVLDAMKVNERQYIYQLRRLGARNGAQTSDKIEW